MLREGFAAAAELEKGYMEEDAARRGQVTIREPGSRRGAGVAAGSGAHLEQSSAPGMSRLHTPSLPTSDTGRRDRSLRRVDVTMAAAVPDARTNVINDSTLVNLNRPIAPVEAVTRPQETRVTAVTAMLAAAGFDTRGDDVVGASASGGGFTTYGGPRRPVFVDPYTTDVRDLVSSPERMRELVDHADNHAKVTASWGTVFEVVMSSLLCLCLRVSRSVIVSKSGAVVPPLAVVGLIYYVLCALKSRHCCGHGEAQALVALTPECSSWRLLR